MAYLVGDFKRVKEKFGYEPFEWTAARMHYATLNAAAKRGLVEKVGRQYKLTAKVNKFIEIEDFMLTHEFITLKEPSAKLGMLCSLKGMDVLDAWDNPYNYSADVEIIKY